LTGPAGPQGASGATGATGPAGAFGSLTSPNSTISVIGGTTVAPTIDIDWTSAINCEGVQDCVGSALQLTGLMGYADAANGFTAGGTAGAADAGAIPITTGAGTVVYTRPPTLTPTVHSEIVYGKNCATGAGEFVKVIERYSYRSTAVSTTLVPASDRIVGADTSGGNVTVTLAEPGACDPLDYHIKKLSSANTLIVSVTGGTIDGLSSVSYGSGLTGVGVPPNIHVYRVAPNTWITL
jgi:hypothetical protein